MAKKKAYKNPKPSPQKTIRVNADVDYTILANMYRQFLPLWEYREAVESYLEKLEDREVEVGEVVELHLKHKDLQKLRKHEELKITIRRLLEHSAVVEVQAVEPVTLDLRIRWRRVEVLIHE